MGLLHDVTTAAEGEGRLELWLRHLPPQDGTPTKVEGLAEVVAVDGLDAIGGATDVQVGFDVSVE